MTEWSGKVTKTSSRDWGNKTLYSWQIEGANMWFRSEEDLGVEMDTWIKFEGENPNKITSCEVVEAEVVKEKASSGTNGTGGLPKEAPPTNSPDYWRWKQMHDLQREDAFLWRDARADAVRVITACLAHDTNKATSKETVLSLGTKKSGRLDVLRGMINELSGQFVDEMKERIGG